MPSAFSRRSPICLRKWLGRRRLPGRWRRHARSVTFPWRAGALGAADFLDGGGEDLHDVEPVHGDRGLRKTLRGRGEEGGGHIADDRGDSGGLAGVL